MLGPAPGARLRPWASGCPWAPAPGRRPDVADLASRGLRDVDKGRCRQQSGPPRPRWGAGARLVLGQGRVQPRRGSLEPRGTGHGARGWQRALSAWLAVPGCPAVWLSAEATGVCVSRTVGQEGPGCFAFLSRPQSPPYRGADPGAWAGAAVVAQGGGGDGVGEGPQAKVTGAPSVLPRQVPAHESWVPAMCLASELPPRTEEGRSCQGSCIPAGGDGDRRAPARGLGVVGRRQVGDRGPGGEGRGVVRSPSTQP